MLHQCRTGTALVGLDVSLSILIEPQERGRPVVVTDTEALIRPIDSCEAERERVLAATELASPNSQTGFGCHDALWNRPLNVPGNPGNGGPEIGRSTASQVIEAAP